MNTLSQTIALVQQAVDSLRIERRPHSLYEPIEYALACGGKRLRPVLTILAHQLWADDHQAAMPYALAFEVYHNYTLLHDDLMDNADMRRGRPAVHRRWDANTAILSGDAMLTYAIDMVVRAGAADPRAVLGLFTETALQVCEGQQYDMDFETRADVTEDEYIKMITLKTSVLLAAALKAGAMLAGAPAADCDKLYDFGIRLGLAFQLQDDYLDVYGDPATFGKRIGGDILCGKKTYMLINALAKDPSLAAVVAQPAHTGEQQRQKIAAVTERYNRLGIPAMAQERISAYFAEAMQLLESVAAPDSRKQPLAEFAQMLMGRQK